jgi:hypothetical protein
VKRVYRGFFPHIIEFEGKGMDRCCLDEVENDRMVEKTQVPLACRSADFKHLEQTSNESCTNVLRIYTANMLVEMVFKVKTR